MSLSIVLIFALAIHQSCHQAVDGCPNIVSRSQWGARAPVTSTPLNTPVDYFVVHHTAGPTCQSIPSCSRVVRGTQNYHTDNEDYWDIGYNFLIGGDGSVYEGRGWDTVGAHAGVTYYNQNGLGVAMMGVFTSTMPTQAALDALDDMLACAITKNKLVANDYHVVGHRDIKATSCPGTMFYDNYVTRMPNYGLP